jgi:hypothetical protein
MHKAFSFGSFKMEKNRYLSFPVDPPTIKTPFIEIFEQKMQQKKLYYKIVAKFSNL